MIISKVYMHAGKAVRYNDAVDLHVCCSLLAACSLTGCNSTSSFYQTGKRGAYTKLIDLAKKHPQALGEFSVSGNEVEDAAAARQYVLMLDRTKHKCTALHYLRRFFVSTTDRVAASQSTTT